jgi:hypothetical protein
MSATVGMIGKTQGFSGEVFVELEGSPLVLFSFQLMQELVQIPGQWPPRCCEHTAKQPPNAMQA